MNRGTLEAQGRDQADARPCAACVTTGAPTSPSCSASPRRPPCSPARWSSAIRCAAACATSRSGGSGRTDTGDVGTAILRRACSRPTCDARRRSPRQRRSSSPAALSPTKRRAGAQPTCWSTAWTSGSGPSTALPVPRAASYLSPALAAELGAQRRRRTADARAEAGTDSHRVALRQQGRRRPDAPPPGDGRAAARAARRVLAAAAAGKCGRCSCRSTALQRDLGVQWRVNTVLLSGAARRAGRSTTTLRLGRLGRAGRPRSPTAPGGPTLLVESAERHRQRRARAAAGGAAAGSACPPCRCSPTWRTRSARTASAGSVLAGHGDRIWPCCLLDAAPARRPRRRPTRIVLNEWAARELGASAGDASDVDYYLWDAAAGLQTKCAELHACRRSCRSQGLAADRRLAPEYPGITAGGEPCRLGSAVSSRSLARPSAWTRRTGASTGRRRRRSSRTSAASELWRSRYGAADVVAVPARPPRRLPRRAERRSALRCAASFRRRQWASRSLPVRAQALAASSGRRISASTSPISASSSWSSALLLVVLFFKLGVEQRLRETGILRASGFTMADDPPAARSRRRSCWPSAAGSSARPARCSTRGSSCTDCGPGGSAPSAPRC